MTGTTRGTATVLAICSLADVKVAHRKLLAEIVDIAAGDAVSGAKPKVRAYPGPEATAALQALREYAASPSCTPDQSARLSHSVVVCATYGRQLNAAGIDVCLLVGTYDVVDVRNHSDDLARPALFFNSDGELVYELHRSAPPA